jgi:hypothetical protein
MLIVGSKAFAFHFPNSNRVNKDVDIIDYQSNISALQALLQPKKIIQKEEIVSFIDIENKTDIFNTKNVEVLLADNSVAFQSYLRLAKEKNMTFASPEILLSMKRSHIHFPIYFKKHIEDYTFLKSTIKEDTLDAITKIARKEIEERIGKLKTPSLNKKVTEFFNQSEGYVQYFFVHDDIHQAVAHYNRPLFLEMQKDITMAKCEKSLWDKFTFENKCKCVLEEAYVIALERRILPSIFGKSKWFSSEESLEWSLMRICTTLCSGWFREFATDNYFEIKKFINKNYVEDFLEKYHKNEIERLK